MIKVETLTNDQIRVICDEVGIINLLPVSWRLWFQKPLIEHSVAYWVGGNSDGRLEADDRLLNVMLLVAAGRKTFIGRTYLYAVSGLLYPSFRHFGWSFWHRGVHRNEDDLTLLSLKSEAKAHYFTMDSSYRDRAYGSGMSLCRYHINKMHGIMKEPPETKEQ